MIKLIVAVDRNWAIGNNGKLLTNIPDDTRFFNQVTMNQVVIMGRKTLESLPQGQPLPNRINIVISRNPNYKVEGATVVGSIEEALKEANKYTTDIYVAGGASIYIGMLKYCEEALVTYIDYSYQADTRMVNLDKRPEWVLVDESEEQTHFDVIYYFRTYKKRKDFLSI